jgi:hypothetical protein
MNLRDIPMWEFVSKTRTHRHDHPSTGHTHFWQRAMSRRQFARTAAGIVVVGATLGSGLHRSGLAKEQGSNEPVPIPGGIQVGGQTFHVFGPGLNGNPPDQEPSTITVFNGFVGLAYLDGMVTQTDTKTGEVRRLPFLTSDMRFMQGIFRDTEGQMHQGAFALV